jgi:hypothetical protein
MRAPLLLATAAVLGTAACRTIPPTVREPEPQSRSQQGIVTFYVEGGRYVIDPYTETCFLSISGGYALGVVPCAKLKENLPQAGKYITWTEDAPGSERGAAEGP